MSNDEIFSLKFQKKTVCSNQQSFNSNVVLIKLLLYGDKDLSDNMNKIILELTLNFFHKTGRFD